jgi:light-regulated signal transduction histidine kinase (bacteriophytochrome)
VTIENRLPALLDGRGYFVWPIQLLTVPALALAGACALLSRRRYCRSGDNLMGHAALSLLLYCSAFAIFCLSRYRFDLWWCLSRVAALGGSFAMLNGLLAGYVTLYRREHERGRALQSIIADLRRAEGLLSARAQALATANAELESFSYSVSHDLRTQLHILIAFVYLLEEEYGPLLGGDGRDYLQQISRSVESMNTVIRTILKLSGISQQEMNLTSVDISAIAASIIAELRQEEPYRRVETVVQDGLTACGDPSLVTVALANLIRNAWKFTGRKETARIEIGAAETGGQQAFFVRDNGAGFDTAQSDKMFKPFKRLHSQQEFTGTGIGLAIVERAVRRHGGRIWAEGEVEQGACFYFTLPEP